MPWNAALNAGRHADLLLDLVHRVDGLAQRRVRSQIEGERHHRKLALVVHGDGGGRGLPMGESAERHLLPPGNAAEDGIGPAARLPLFPAVKVLDDDDDDAAAGVLDGPKIWDVADPPATTPVEGDPDELASPVRMYRSRKSSGFR